MRDNGHGGFAGRADSGALLQPQRFTVETRPDRDRVVVMPHGELDLATVDAVAAEVDDLVARGFDRIVIDLRETSFIDSSGVHLLLRCAARDDVRVTVIDGPPAVARIFDLVGVRQHLPFEVAQ